MILGIHHVAISVPDMDRALAFYRDVLGFELVQEGQWNRDYPEADQAIGLSETAARMVMLKTHNAHIELWEYHNPPPEDRRARPCDLGYPHFALQVEDMAAEYERLSAAGMTFVGPPVELGSSSAVYGADPFGNVIEIYEIRDAAISQIARPAT